MFTSEIVIDRRSSRCQNVEAPPSSPNLPSDILRAIMPRLPRSDLVTCCRVSRAFYAISTPSIYERLTVDPSHARKSALAGSNSRSSAAVLDGDIRPIPLPDRFSYTTHLTLQCHTRTACEALSPAALPNLITLRISGQSEDICGPPRGCTKAYRKTVYTTLCPLLANLRPRRVVLHQDNLQSAYGIGGLSTRDQPFPQPWVEELVILVDPCVHHAFAWCDVPSTVQRLIIVLRPTDAGNAARQKRQVDVLRRAGFSESQAWAELADTLCKWLARACTGDAGEMIIVGLESIAQELRTQPVAVRQEAARKGLKERLMEIYNYGRWKEDSAGKRAGELRFVELADYQGET